ncbi:MAG: hypothetical protein ACTSR8_14010 [Promethearchaeota archaeon]
MSKGISYNKPIFPQTLAQESFSIEERSYLNIWSKKSGNPSLVDCRESYVLLRVSFVIGIIVLIMSLMYFITLNIWVAGIVSVILGAMLVIIFHEGFGDIPLWMDLHLKQIVKLRPFKNLFFLKNKEKDSIIFMFNKKDLTTTGLGIYQVQILPENVKANFEKFIKAMYLLKEKVPFTFQITQSSYDPLGVCTSSRYENIKSSSSFTVNIYFCCYYRYKGMLSARKLSLIGRKVHHYLEDMKGAFGSQYRHYKISLLQGNMLTDALRTFFLKKELPQTQSPAVIDINKRNMLIKLFYTVFLVGYITFLLALLGVPLEYILFISAVLPLILMVGLWKGILLLYCQKSLHKEGDYIFLQLFEGFDVYFIREIPDSLFIHIDNKILVDLKSINLHYANGPHYDMTEKVFHSILRHKCSYIYTVSAEPIMPSEVIPLYEDYMNNDTYYAIQKKEGPIEEWLTMRDGIWDTILTVSTCNLRNLTNLNERSFTQAVRELEEEARITIRNIRNSFESHYPGFSFSHLRRKLLLHGFLQNLVKNKHFKYSGTQLDYIAIQGINLKNLVQIPSELKKGVETRIAAEFNSPLSLENFITIGNSINLEYQEDEIPAGFTYNQLSNILITEGSAEQRDLIIQKIVAELIKSEIPSLVFDFSGDYSRLIAYFEDTRYANEILHFKVGHNINIDLLNSGIPYDKKNSDYLEYMFDASALAFKQDRSLIEAFKSIILRHQGTEADLISIKLDQENKQRWEKNTYEDRALSFIIEFAENALVLSKDKASQIGAYEILKEERTVIIDLSDYELPEQVFIEFVFLSKYIHYLKHGISIPQKHIIAQNIEIFFDEHYMDKEPKTTYGKMDKFLRPLIINGPGMIATCNRIHYLHDNASNYFNNLIALKTINARDLEVLRKLINLQEMQGQGFYSKSRNNTYQMQYIMTMEPNEVLVKRSDIKQAFPIHIYTDEITEYDSLDMNKIINYMEQQGFDHKAAEKFLLEQSSETIFEKDLGNYFALIEDIIRFLDGIKTLHKVALYRSKLKEGLRNAIYNTLSKTIMDKGRISKMRDTLLDILIKHGYLIEAHPKNAAGGESIRTSFKVGPKYQKALNDYYKSQKADTSVEVDILQNESKEGINPTTFMLTEPTINLVDEMKFTRALCKQVGKRLMYNTPLNPEDFATEDEFKKVLLEKQNTLYEFLLKVAGETIAYDGISLKELDLMSIINALGATSYFPFSKKELLSFLDKCSLKHLQDADLATQAHELYKIYEEFLMSILRRLKYGGQKQYE